jgi:mRNA-degrading endonuclease RelE of RelBE toxin-antitoxin system
MTFKVFLSDHSQADLKRLPQKIHRQVIEDIRRLSSNPIPEGKRIKKLKGFKEDLYRLRAGDFQVVFQREGASLFVVRVLAKKDFKKVYG